MNPSLSAFWGTQVSNKKKKSISEQLLRVDFSTFCVKIYIFLLDCSVRPKKLHNVSFITSFWPKIGYHSNLNPECKGEWQFINQLYIQHTVPDVMAIALFLQGQCTSFMVIFVSLNQKSNSFYFTAVPLLSFKRGWSIFYLH